MIYATLATMHAMAWIHWLQVVPKTFLNISAETLLPCGEPPCCQLSEWVIINAKQLFFIAFFGITKMMVTAKIWIFSRILQMEHEECHHLVGFVSLKPAAKAATRLC